MNYAYENLPNAEFDAAFDRSFAMIILGYMAFMFLIGLVLWILRSRSLHKIGGRRGIRHAWLAWLPVGTEWVLGSVADQYQHLVRGRVTSRRKIILVLALVSFAMYIAAMAIGLLTIFAVIPEQVILSGEVSGDDREELESILTEELGIAKEEQQWNGQKRSGSFGAG